MYSTVRRVDKPEKRLLKRYPGLALVSERHDRTGPVRVLRKSLREIEELRSALPDKYFEYEWYDFRGSARADKVNEDYFILWYHLKIKHLPSSFETIVYLIKEESVMFTIEQLSQVKKAADILWDLLDAQLAELNESLLEKVIERTYKKLMKEQGADTIYKVQDDYLKAARAEIKKANYADWDEVLVNLSTEYGFNPMTGNWDVQNPKEFWDEFYGCGDKKEVEDEKVYFLAKTVPDSIGFNLIITAARPITKEEYDALPKISLIGSSGGYCIYENEEAFDTATVDGPEPLGGDAEIYLSEKEDEIAFGLTKEEVFVFYDYMFKSDSRVYFAFRV